MSLLTCVESTCVELCKGPGTVEFPALMEAQLLHGSACAVTAVAGQGFFRQRSADIGHAVGPIAALCSGAHLADGLFGAVMWDFHGAWPSIVLTRCIAPEVAICRTTASDVDILPATSRSQFS